MFISMKMNITCSDLVDFQVHFRLELPPQIRALVVFTMGYNKNIWREIGTLLRGNIFQRSSVSDLIVRCFKDGLKEVG
jgi:hypothetical protein